MTPSLKSQFLLNPDITFLNHGSFGACPKPVFEAYQHWQRELEQQPVEFLGRRFPDLMNQARSVLADYLNTPLEDLIFVPNATVGINIVARSLDLQPGDEVLTTDHEYGAVDETWQYVCEKTGAAYIRQAIPLPVDTHEDFVERLWSAVTPHTRVIAISHITSPTALIFPIEEICRRAREAGILTVVDGAHAPGQIPLDMIAIGADFYTGNCHKWLCAPKGAAFLYVRSEHHPMLIPPVISWGWRYGSTFVEHHQWQGTRDIAAYLSVPDAINFQKTHNWETVRSECHKLALNTRDALQKHSSLPHIAPESWFIQMFSAPLPPCDPETLKTRLYDDYRVEVPIIEWQGKPYVRVSIQGYNSEIDTENLLRAMVALL